MSDNVIIWNTRDPLCGLTSEDFECALKTLLNGRVKEAWVFGSFARGDMHRDSDIDLALIVDETDHTFFERASAFFDLHEIGPQLDLLVYTAAEWATLTNTPTVGFWTDVMRDKKRII